MTSARLQTLDGLRGVAVMGILLMNIIAFAMPQAAYSNPRAFGAHGALDYAIWAINFVLVDGKMRALFSMLFGASMLLVIRRAEAAGEDGQRVHFRRMRWLLAFGLVHALLIWFGDILVLYAITGMIAWFFVERSNRVLLGWSAALLALQLALWIMIYLSFQNLAAAAAAPGASTEDIAAWLSTNAQLGLPTRFDLQEEIAHYRGSYATILVKRIAAATPLYELVVAGPETLGYMLLGMVGLRSGFLSGAWDRSAYLRTARWAYALSIPPMLALTAWCFVTRFDALTVIGVAQVAALPFRPILMLGHAALLLGWFLAGETSLKARIAAAGRAAFTNYLATSLILTTLFYGYGFGLYATLGRAELYLVVLLVWTGMLAWSAPWLARFRFGPVEWMWRSLARGAAQPMRKAIETCSQ